MIQREIFGPMFALMVLVFAVWVLMYLRRRAFVLKNKVKLRDIATPETIAAVIGEYANNPANNLRNLFELPVLFYAISFYLYAFAQVDTLYLVLAWVFVAFRYVHSYVHCTSNRVSRRLMFYALSSFALWAMIARAGATYLLQSF
jgi:hypothetical protein